MADCGGPAAVAPERFELFEAAWRLTGCPLDQLWVQYLGVGGSADLFSLDAFLHGVAPLSPAQQDVLANALNERLDDLYQAAKVPYLRTFDHAGATCDPLTVLDQLFRRPPPQSDRT